jgi:hypothetical protein
MALSIKTGKGGTHAGMVRVFEKNSLPSLGRQAIHEIGRRDLLEVVARFERRDALMIVRRVHGWLRQAFRHDLMKVPGLEYNPAADLDDRGRPATARAPSSVPAHERVAEVAAGTPGVQQRANPADTALIVAHGRRHPRTSSTTCMRWNSSAPR